MPLARGTASTAFVRAIPQAVQFGTCLVMSTTALAAGLPWQAIIAKMSRAIFPSISPT